MRNIALTLKYLGTAYHGWQVQKTVTTVGQTLEEAAAAVVGHPVHMTGCGRTDAGVHARVYVANFRTSARIPCDRIPYALNTHLPEDIVVTNAMEVHEDFNAIGSCVKKEYTYLIYNSGIRDPFYVNRAWFYPKHLDETVMQRAADCFIGTHDFAAVRSVGTDVKSTVRTVYDYKVERDGDLISLRVSANGFLYNMARAMAGTCVYAAEGKFPPEAVAQILLNGDRTAAGPTVPPGGLYMTQLWYDDGKAVFHVGSCLAAASAEASGPWKADRRVCGPARVCHGRRGGLCVPRPAESGRAAALRALSERLRGQQNGPIRLRRKQLQPLCRAVRRAVRRLRDGPESLR